MGPQPSVDKYSGVVEVRLRRSARLRAAIVLAGLATLGVVALTPLPLAAALLMATFTACSGLWAYHRANSRPRLYIEHSGAVSVDGVAGCLRPGSFVAPWLAILRWRPAGARFDRTVVVFPDMLPATSFRELRVVLLWGQTTLSAFTNSKADKVVCPSFAPPPR